MSFGWDCRCGSQARSCNLCLAISPLIFRIWNGLPVPNYTTLKGLAKNVYDLGSHVIALMKNYADTLIALQETTSCKTRVFDRHQEAEDDKMHFQLLLLLIKRGYVLMWAWGIRWEHSPERVYSRIFVVRKSNNWSRWLNILFFETILVKI